MERRKFIETTAIGLPVITSMNIDPLLAERDWCDAEKELYEIRTYEMKFRGNEKLLLEYLQNVLKPALFRFGVNHFMLFNEYGDASPKKIWLFISYPDMSIYLKGQNLSADGAYMKSAATYDAAPTAIYNRYTSSLLWAFDGMKQLLAPSKDAGLFELRTYEGYSEDAVRRKIKMFNKEEFPLFYEVGLIPVFFGEVLAGPLRPCLTYMVACKDMEARNAGWKKFFAHPDWNTMKVKPEYANTVSNIHKTFLVPMK